MALFNRASSEARQELRDARAELERVSPSGSTEETPAYLTANERVAAAEQAVKDSRSGRS